MKVGTRVRFLREGAIEITENVGRVKAYNPKEGSVVVEDEEDGSEWRGEVDSIAEVVGLGER